MLRIGIIIRILKESSLSHPEPGRNPTSNEPESDFSSINNRYWTLCKNDFQMGAWTENGQEKASLLFFILKI